LVCLPFLVEHYRAVLYNTNQQVICYHSLLWPCPIYPWILFYWILLSNILDLCTWWCVVSSSTPPSCHWALKKVGNKQLYQLYVAVLCQHQIYYWLNIYKINLVNNCIVNNNTKYLSARCYNNATFPSIWYTKFM